MAEVAGGVANRGFVLGDGLFLRVARPGFEDDLRKETAVIPVARSAGVLTPAIVEYDDSRTTDRCAVRRDGASPRHRADRACRRGWRSNWRGCTGPSGPTSPALPQDDGDDPWRTVDDLAERGYVDLGTAKWLSDWFTRLADRFDRNEPKVLIHGDVAAHNLLAGPDGELPGPDRLG